MGETEVYVSPILPSPVAMGIRAARGSHEQCLRPGSRIDLRDGIEELRAGHLCDGVDRWRAHGGAETAAAILIFEVKLLTVKGFRLVRESASVGSNSHRNRVIIHH
jgi:hypothetical protein